MNRKLTLAEDGSRIEEFLDAVLDEADFDVEYEITEGATLHPDFENPDVLVNFSGPDVELLLANKAEALLALEQLTMEALRLAPEEHSRLCFDANEHRRLRIQELRMSAQAAADRVRKSHAPFHFSPMNNRERRILHLALTGEAGIRSESVGEGPIRQVVIVPEDMKTLPEPIVPPRPRPETPGRPERGGRGRDRRGPPRGPHDRRGRDRGRR